MQFRTAMLMGVLALAGCATPDAAAIGERPLLSVETRLSCAADAASGEKATRGPRRSYDGEALPSAPAPASADADVKGVTPRRACVAGERLAALMLAMPELTASIDATGAVALVEAVQSADAPRRAGPPPLPRAMAPPPVDRAAEAAARAAAAVQGRVRQAR